ncbi:cell adhesion molecule 2-like [Antedon mediterranea]|uniref:cell adhesion molecule 2-like n=1 Tax=Antedon mediterranea TaxID=105859 RepID=UPI003AF8CCA6
MFYISNCDLFSFIGVYLVSSLVVVSGSFSTNPEKQEAKEGGSAYMFCLYPEDLNEGEELAWFRSRVKISNLNQVIRETVDDPLRYIFDFDEATRRYGLTIKKLKRSDATDYACAVVNGDTTNFADSAYLTVNEIPKKPICLSVEDTYPEGLSAKIICGVEKTNPPAIVTWKRGNTVLQTFQENNNEHEFTYYSYTFKPNFNDNRATFTCQVKTEIDDSFQVNCTTGIINVLYKPRVSIPDGTDINEGKEAVLFCESDANPDATSYDWKFEPDIDPNRLKFENNNKILRIIAATKDLNESKVICTSSNTVGSSSAYVTLIINPPQLKTYTTGGVYDPADQQVNGEEGLAFTVPLILALAGGCSVLFLFLLLIPICYIHMFGRKRVMTPDGRIIAQPDIYFEPRDRIMPPLPGLPDGMTWVRSVGVQVPGEAESESAFYAEISGSRKSACSAYGSYTGYGTYGRRSTYI